MTTRSKLLAIAATMLLTVTVVPGCSPQRGFETHEQAQVGQRPTRAESAKPAQEKSGPSRGVIVLGVIATVVAVPVLILVLL